MRVLKYFNGSRKYHLALSLDTMRVIKWYVDASFVVHPNFKSRIGGIMIWGTGVTQSGSIKQKLNIRSSTEAEVVSVDDMASNIFWGFLYWLSRI